MKVTKFVVRTYKIDKARWSVSVYEHFTGYPPFFDRIFNSRETYPGKDDAAAIGAQWLIQAYAPPKIRAGLLSEDLPIVYEHWWND